MAFSPEATVTPAARGGMTVEFYIPDPGKADEVQRGRLDVQVYYSDGSLKIRHFDLLARLADDQAGQGHLANLVALQDYIIARVDAEVIGA